MNYFSTSNGVKDEIDSRRRNGETLPQEDIDFRREVDRQQVIQGILAMSEEELEVVRREYCAYLEQEKHYGEEERSVGMSNLIKLYNSMTLDEFRQSMLRPSVLGNLSGYSMKSRDYIVSGTFQWIGANAYVFDFRKDEIDAPNLSEPGLKTIKTDAMQRSEEIKEKLESGMSLYEATHTEIGYRDIQGRSK